MISLTCEFPKAGGWRYINWIVLVLFSFFPCLSFNMRKTSKFYDANVHRDNTFTDSNVVVSGTALTRRLHWAVWAVTPTILSAILRKRGGFFYRTTASLVCMAAIALYGVLASLTLPLVGKAHLINWSVARLYYHIGGYFTGLSATIEGKEHLRSDRPSVYVCNHQTSMDVLFMASVFPKATAVVAKKSIKYYPFLGWYSKCFTLDQNGTSSSSSSCSDFESCHLLGSQESQQCY